MIITRRGFLSVSALALSSIAARAKDTAPVALEAKEGSLSLTPNQNLAIWGYNGQSPGPLLRISHGDSLHVRLTNHLPQPTSLHWCGVRIDNAMDGAAGLTQQPIKPGESFDYRFTPPDPGTYLYQPLTQPFAGEQMGRGLFGALIVDEKNAPAVDEDAVIFLRDWRLDNQGRLAGDFNAVADAARQGRLGAQLSLNAMGVDTAHPWRRSFPPGARVRLRLINAANARLMAVTLEGAKPFIVAIDGQSCSAFQPVQNTVPMGPSARFDLIFDMPTTPGAQTKLIVRGEAELPDQTAAILTAEGELKPSRPSLDTPGVYAPVNPALPSMIRLQDALKLEIAIAGAMPKSGILPPNAVLAKLWTINGVASNGYEGKPLFSVKRGTPVSIGLSNTSLYPVVMHIHGHKMRVLHDLDDGWDPYWRDSIIVPNGRTKHVAFVADNPGRWMLRGAVLEHFAAGLATWFEVV